MAYQTPIDRNHPDRPYTDLLEGVEFRPVFILGAHRSGTTLLYQLLQASGQFNVVSLYHVVSYDEILHNHIRQKERQAKQSLARSSAASGVVNRVIDHVEVSPELPEEYGYILRNASCRPYLDETSLSKFIELCKKIQFVSDRSRPLLLKNPRDFTRFRFIIEKFPDAKFIFIHRNPVHTINSHLKAIRSVFRTRSAYQAMISRSYARMFSNPVRLLFGRLRVSTRLGLDLRRSRRSFEEKADYFLANIDSLPATAYLSVKYEELCERPQAGVRDILQFLELSTATDKNYTALINTREAGLTDEIRKKKMEIMRRLEAYCTYCGY